MAGAINRQTALIGQTDRRGFVARGYPCKTSAPDQTQSAELAKYGDCLPSKKLINLNIKYICRHMGRLRHSRPQKIAAFGKWLIIQIYGTATAN
jgi:hypothetical protein